jgi:hypothetical protein
MRTRFILALLAGVGWVAVASGEPELPDAELLEFLGSWEGEGDEWQEFFDSLPVISDAALSVEKRNERRMTGEPD